MDAKESDAMVPRDVAMEQGHPSRFKTEDAKAAMHSETIRGIEETLAKLGYPSRVKTEDAEAAMRAQTIRCIEEALLFIWIIIMMVLGTVFAPKTPCVTPYPILPFNYLRWLEIWTYVTAAQIIFESGAKAHGQKCAYLVVEALFALYQLAGLVVGTMLFLNTLDKCPGNLRQYGGFLFALQVTLVCRGLWLVASAK